MSGQRVSSRVYLQDGMRMNGVWRSVPLQAQGFWQSLGGLACASDSSPDAISSFGCHSSFGHLVLHKRNRSGAKN